MTSLDSPSAARPDGGYPDSDELRVALDGGVLTVTFHRPERNNAWTHTMEHAYFETLLAAAADPAVRVVVVTGAGKSFCPGVDVQILEAVAVRGERTGGQRRWPMTLPRLIPKPIVGAVNGACAGVGFVQMACCDVVFAASTAKFSTAFVRRGLPGEHSISWMLARQVGTTVAMDLLLSGRVLLAEEAKELGLVNKVLAPEELLPAAQAYARDIAENCSPAAMAVLKRQVLDDWERTSEESRFRSLVHMGELAAGTDFAEGVLSFQERRPPQFPGYAEQLHVPRSIQR